MKCVKTYHDLTTLNRTKYRQTAEKWQKLGHEIAESHVWLPGKATNYFYWKIIRNGSAT